MNNLLKFINSYRVIFIVLILGLIDLFSNNYLSLSFFMFLTDSSVLIFITDFHIDYFVYPLNFFIIILFTLSGVIFFEFFNRIIKPKANNNKHKPLIILACLFFSIGPHFFTRKFLIDYRFILAVQLQSFVAFFFLYINAIPKVFGGFLSNSKWFGSLKLIFCFFSDILFYRPWIERRKDQPIYLKYSSLISLVFILSLLLLKDIKPIITHTKASRINIDSPGPVEINDTFYSEIVNDQLLFTNTNWNDANAGLWTYNFENKIGKLLYVYLDAINFIMDKGVDDVRIDS